MENANISGRDLHMGGGGGGSYWYGGNGGGLVVLGAETMIVESGGRISANGQNGESTNGTYVGSGGGAGGTVAIFATTLDNQGTIEAKGDCDGFDGADGGAGGEVYPRLTPSLGLSTKATPRVWRSGWMAKRSPQPSVTPTTKAAPTGTPPMRRGGPPAPSRGARVHLTSPTPPTGP